MRELAELTSGDSAWPVVKQWAASASNAVDVLEAKDPARSATLLWLQVTVGSPMGAIAYETGGILVDHGWLRVLASGHLHFPRDIVTWSRAHGSWHGSASPALLLIADDVLGGTFALNGGAFGGTPGSVYYLAPDTLQWEPLDRTYSEFIRWAFSGDLAKFYDGLRWPGWQNDVRNLPGDRAFSIYPFLWAKGPPLAERSRRVVPIAELFELQLDARRRLFPDTTDFG